MDRYLTPPEVARRFGVSTSKVTTWISRGEIVALNLATAAGGRPRWRISPEALADFEARRSAQPKPKQQRRRRAPKEMVRFFS